MASTEYQVQNTSGEVKYDAFPSCDALKFDLSDILKTNGFNVAASDSHSNADHDSDNHENFYALLSDKRKDNQVSLISPCEVDVSLPGLSTDRAFEKDPKPTDFLGFTCPTTTTKSMKFKDTSECEGSGFLSDLLSPVTNNPSNHNDSHVFDDDVSLADICVPKLHETKTPKSSNVKKGLSSDSSDFDLSDILSSLSVGESNQSKSGRFKNSSVKNCEPSLSFDDFKISNQVSHIKKNSTEANQESLSDIFSLLDASNLSPNKIDASRKLDHSLNQKPISQTMKINEGETISDQDQATFNSFNLDDCGKVSIVDDDKRKGEQMPNMDFSFLSNVSGKASSYSQTLDNDEDSKHAYSSSEDSGVSMMDFLSALEVSKESTSTSEDDSDKYSSDSLRSSTPENQDVLEAVDLNFCIKTPVDKSNAECSATEDNSDTPHQFKGPENNNPVSQVNPLPLKHSVDPVTSNKKMKPSLFSKSFACQFKKNPSLVHKVANIKADILNQTFGCSMPVNFHRKAPLPNVASYSDNPLISYAGRRMFDISGASVVC